MPDLIYCLMGPTASGKTALACALAEHYSFEIVSVDSALIYREMNIGTAKPSKEELRQFPHHLINIKNPDESYSAADFCSDARAVCNAVIQRGNIPLLVGGTMMYFNALQKGLSQLPQADETIRAALVAREKQEGLHVLYEELKQVDKNTAARIHAHDTQRIQRALEVYYITGTPLSELQNQNKVMSEYRFMNIVLFPNNRAWLHERIATRFAAMLAIGLIDEVLGLLSRWNLNTDMPSMRCVGYRQVLEHLEGQYDETILQDKGIAATRQLAKRQLTWLRQWQDAVYYDPEDERVTQEIIRSLAPLI
jgi:tRNA dimethylallyltransferase